MKKALSLILALVICFSMCACAKEASTNEPTTNEIQLTLENYEQYLNIDRCYCSKTTKGVSVGYFGTVSRCYKLTSAIVIEGVSSNFNYNNVKIQVRCSGTYGTNNLVSASSEADKGSYQTFDIVVEVPTNIAGSGELFQDLVLAPGGRAIVEVVSKCEVIGVSGTVSPA